VGEKREAGLPRALKATVAGIVVVTLLAVVALGARGGHPGAHYRTHQREVPAIVGDAFLTALVIAFAVGFVILIVAFVLFRHEWMTPRSRWLRDLFLTLLVACLVTLVAYRYFHAHPRRHSSAGNPLGTSGLQRTDTHQTLPQLAAPRQSAHFDWRFAALLAGLALLTAAFFLLRSRGSGGARGGEPDVEEELEAAVSDSIDDLRREPDPRRAVIAAYARMERVLRRHGRARRAAEAPYEYLERVLTDLHIRPAAVADLTELFERAKFSVHRIDGTMKTRAIDALVSVREDLQRP
jgi:multisubunit Na+/H+ antiporter MnhC subunit